MMIGQNVLLLIGGALVGAATLLYAVTWGLMVLKPGWLLGNITMLWFRALIRILTFGLIVISLCALNVIIRTALFWRT